MADEQARGKWNRRYSETPSGKPAACAALREYAFLLPETGTALDLACGRGGNALFLARRGLQAHAWDISEEAIGTLVREAEAEGLRVVTEVRDVQESPPAPGTFDVICVSFYLERDICGALTEALRSGGLLYYQTFIHEKVSDEGPNNPAYRLNPNELLGLFAPLHVLVYRELGRTGDTGQGVRDTAWLVAQKP